MQASAAQNRTLPRFRVFNTPVHAVSRRTAALELETLLEGGRPEQVVTVNLDFLRLARSSAQFNQVIDEAALAVPDGAPLVWMARYLGLPSCERVTGPDLIEACAALSVQRSFRLFFLGAAPGVAERAADVLRERYPGLEICGTFAPPEHDLPFPRSVDEEIVARVREARPHALFVAFGCPKQDLWIHEHLRELEVPVSVGIGASLNFLCGLIPRAPARLQRFGLEWAHRLYREPRRLWRRYLLQDMPFALRVLTAEAAKRARLSQTIALAVEG